MRSSCPSAIPRARCTRACAPVIPGRLWFDHVRVPESALRARPRRRSRDRDRDPLRDCAAPVRRQRRALPLLSYPTHGRRFLPRLARTYVLSFAVAGLRQRFAEATRAKKETEASAPADSRELEAQAAAIKALATTHAVDNARACREACGGQG